MPTKLSSKQEIVLTQVLMSITLIAGVLFFAEVLLYLKTYIEERNIPGIFQQLFFIIIVGFLIYGNVLYQLTRVGYFTRHMKHHHASHEELEHFAHQQHVPAVTILVPSYKEDLRTVRETLLSVALQDYPKKRIVLLIDDPQNPKKAADKNSLQAARQLPQDLQFIFDVEAKKYHDSLSAFVDRVKTGPLQLHEEAAKLIALEKDVIAWFNQLISLHPGMDLQEQLLLEKVFHPLVQSQTKRIQRLQHGLNQDQLLHEYKRLATLFKVEITSFERRSYINLTHEPNKAANLNSYMSLLGKSFRPVRMHTGLQFLSEKTDKPTMTVPNADYVLTTDADSVLLPEYIMRLVHFMEQKENRRVAVVQTPYSANPKVTNPLERLAGATTDIQYIIHQGFTHYNATFWVGANALIRKKALDDIAEKERHGSFNIIRYIQDRTVIEDTESTIDLVDKGWQLYNYPARLAHSATPPDFGSLLIQRRRWANGGFIILPKLLRYLFIKPYKRGKMREGFMRFHYLTSIGFVSLSILLLLLIPFGDGAYSIWLPLTAIPYYLLYARDLILCGYKLTDIFRVYAFNLMLIPINLGGFFKSLQQGVTGKKIPFGRTPKVQGRTAAPALYVSTEYLLLFFCIFAFSMDIYHQYYTHAIYSFVNANFFIYVMTRYIGWGNSVKDIVRSFTSY